MQAKGIDISSNNHVSGDVLDFVKVHQAGIDFIYVKATQGNDYLNEYLLGDTRRAYDAGLRVGIYHFYDTSSGTPEEQADWFYRNGIENVIRACGDILGLYPILDYETGEPNADIRDAFLNHLHNEHGHLAGQYMDRSFFSTLGLGGAYTWLGWPGWQQDDGMPESEKHNGVHCIQYGQEVINGIPEVLVDVNWTDDYHKIQIAFDAPKPTVMVKLKGIISPRYNEPKPIEVIAPTVERRSGSDRRQADRRQ